MKLIKKIHKFVEENQKEPMGVFDSDEEVELELQTTDSYNNGLEDGYSACLLEILKNINVENKEQHMGIIPILFLIFGWCFAIKGLVITSLVISALFATILTLAIFTSTPKTSENYYAGVMQFTVLILSIVKLVKGF